MMKMLQEAGVLALAIVLSLHCSEDLQNLLNGDLLHEPEIQDIIYNQTAVLTVSRSPQSHQYSGYYSRYPTLKSLDHRILFSDLHLENYQTLPEAATTVNAYLLNEGTQPSFPASTVQNFASGTATNSNGNDVSDDQTSTGSLDTPPESLLNDTSIPLVDLLEVDFAQFSPQSIVGEDLTEEDVELIENLWSIDMDLGVSKMHFDPELRAAELEKEREQEMRLKQKEKELFEAEELKNQTDLKPVELVPFDPANFIVDAESGEAVPLDPSLVPQQVPQATNPHLSIGEELQHVDNIILQVRQHLEAYPAVIPSPPQQVPQSMETSALADVSLAPPPAPPSSAGYYNRQTSFDRRWNDLTEMLDLNVAAGHNTSGLAAAAGAQHNATAGFAHNATLAAAAGGSVPTNISGVGPSPVRASPRFMNNSYAGYTAHSYDRPNTNLTELNPYRSELEQLGLGNSSNFPLYDNVSMAQATTPQHNDSFDFASASFTGEVGRGAADEPVGTAAATFSSGLADAVNHSLSLGGSSLLLDDLLSDDSEADSGVHLLNFDEGGSGGSAGGVSGSTSGSSSGNYSPAGSLTPPSASQPWPLLPTPPYDGLEGATGGVAAPEGGAGIVKNEPPFFSAAGGGGPAFDTARIMGGNFSQFENATDPELPGKVANVRHNHTYPAQPGTVPRDLRSQPPLDRDKARISRDQKRISGLGIPFTLDDVVSTPVEEFNSLLQQHELTELQLQTIRDIRRRGKNKVAAQNCRKRKLDVIVSLDDTVDGMRNEKRELLTQRQQLEQQHSLMKERFQHLYREVFQAFRTPDGHAYDPAQFSLHLAADGNVFVVPGNASQPLRLDEEEAEKAARDANPARPHHPSHRQ